MINAVILCKDYREALLMQQQSRGLEGGEMMGQRDSDVGSLERHFVVIADLKQKHLGFEVIGCHLSISSFVAGRQHIDDPVLIDTSVLFFQQIVEARIVFIVIDRHAYHSVHLDMGWLVGEVVIIVDGKFFVGVLDQSEGLVFNTADANVNRAGPPCFVQTIESIVDSVCELENISKSIGPGSSNPGFILFDGFLLSHLFSDACAYTKASK